MLGLCRNRNPELITSREITDIFDVFQHVITMPERHRQIDGQTDRRTTCHDNTALCVSSNGNNNNFIANILR